MPRPSRPASRRCRRRSARSHTGAQQAAATTTDAVQVARSTETTIERLGESSAEIANVIELITSIAAETNMLALNATIEATPSPERPGRGSRSSPPRSRRLLRAQQAAEEIKDHVGRIQTDTDDAVAAIRHVAEVVDAINATQETIASSVEEQHDRGRDHPERERGRVEQWRDRAERRRGCNRDAADRLRGERHAGRGRGAGRARSRAPPDHGPHPDGVTGVAPPDARGVLSGDLQ